MFHKEKFLRNQTITINRFYASYTQYTLYSLKRNTCILFRNISATTELIMEKDGRYLFTKSVTRNKHTKDQVLCTHVQIVVKKTEFINWEGIVQDLLRVKLCKKIICESFSGHHCIIKIGILQIIGIRLEMFQCLFSLHKSIFHVLYISFSFYLFHSSSMPMCNVCWRWRV